MSESGSRPEQVGNDGGPMGEQPGEDRGAEADVPRADASAHADPLRGSRTSGMWAAVLALVVLLVLLSVFVLQNTQPVEVSYFGWQGEAPLAAALLIAVAAGLLIAVTAGSLRILQLRRRVRRERKR